MKKLILIFTVALSGNILIYAQGNNASIDVGMTSEFKEISKFGRVQTGFEGIQTYSSGEIKGSQFFYPTWTNGSVLTTGSETISNKYQFIYDRVRQELFIKAANSEEVLLAEKGQIESFILETDTKHYFEPNTKYDKTATELSFFEVLEKNKNGYSFLKSVTTKFVKANPNDMMASRNGEVNDAFVNTTVYYLYNPATGLQKINLKEKDILKAIAADKVEKTKAYFKENHSEKVDESFVVKLTENLNLN